MTERDDLIRRLRSLAELLPKKHTLPSGADTVICSAVAFAQIQQLAAEAADGDGGAHERGGRRAGRCMRNL